MDTNDIELRQRTNNGHTATNESASDYAHTNGTADAVDAANATQKQPPTVMQTKDNFYDALRIWLHQCQLQQMAYMCFPYYLSTNMPTPDSSASINTPFGTTSSQRFAPFQPPPSFNSVQQPNLITGFEYVIAPVWKRFAAEAIDVIILSIVKLMFVFMLVDLFNIEIVTLDFDTMKTALEEDYLEFLSYSTDLLLVEFITKVLVCIYEAIWTAQGQATTGGGTPGKLLLGIRILYVEAVVPIGQVNVETNFFAPSQMRAIMYPASNPGFKRALMRAIAKNMLMTLMFPMCCVLLFFRNNRTGYDVMTKTIVVEGQPIPIRRQ